MEENEQTEGIESNKRVPTGPEQHETTRADGKANSVPILTPTNKESTNETMNITKKAQDTRKKPTKRHF